MKKIIGIMPGLGFGGAEIQSLLLFNGLCRQGYQVKLIILDEKRAELAGSLDKDIQLMPIRRRAYIDPAAIMQVRRMIKKDKPDIITMVDSYPTIYGFIMNRIFRMKLKNITILHNTIPPNLKCSLQNRIIYGPAINKLGRTVFVSSRQKKYWMDMYSIREAKSVIIHNGIDVSFFEQFAESSSIEKCRQQLGIPLNIPVIAMNASLTPAKCHEHMLAAVERLKKNGIRLFLLIIGDGPRKDYLKDISKSKGISDRIMFTGYVKDIRPYLMCADISALTSVAVETFSVAALESMAMGKPVIMSDIGGACEIVDQGINGYLYNAGNVSDLMTCIKKLLKGKQCQRMGAAAMEKAKVEFGYDKMLNAYVKLIEEELSRP